MREGAGGQRSWGKVVAAAAAAAVRVGVGLVGLVRLMRGVRLQWLLLLLLLLLLLRRRRRWRCGCPRLSCKKKEQKGREGAGCSEAHQWEWVLTGRR